VAGAHMKSRLTFAAALLLAAFLACGGSGEEGAGAGDKIFPYAYSIDDLPNGLRLVTVPTGFPNIVALYIVVQAGSRNEVEPGRSGFAHLFEHMMFRGTPNTPPEKWEEAMQAAGAETNAYTSDDRTVYHAVFSKEDLEPILKIEGDRFQNLKYTEEAFRTETRAVLGEYNKNFASPFRKLDEVLRDNAFTGHSYKHTTMGFIEDVEKMPEMYEYGLQFFDRFYRPEYTIVMIAGDVTKETTLPLVRKYWGEWKRGGYELKVPAEPPQKEPKNVDAPFHGPTLPIVNVAFHAPAYSDEVADSAVLDIISFQAFSDNSALYKKLVIDEQKVDILAPEYYDHRDPFPFAVLARVKQEADVKYVEEQILAAFEGLKKDLMPADELENVKSHLRYQFALSMDSTSAIAGTLAHYLGLSNTPETINKRHRLYRQVTPEQVQQVANKYFIESGRTIVTLRHDASAAGGGQ
jgi:zinc protease